MNSCRSNQQVWALLLAMTVSALWPHPAGAQSRSKSCQGQLASMVTMIMDDGSARSALQPGTTLVCRLDKPIDSKTAKLGDRIEAWVVEPITDRRGALLVPRNSKIIGRIERVHPPRSNRPAMIEVGFDTLQRCRIETRGGQTRDGCNTGIADIIQLSGQLAPLTEEDCKTINEDGSWEGRGTSGKRTFAFVAGGAGGGAIIGGLLTGAVFGGGVGAGIGAGVGAVVSLIGAGKNIKIPEGTKFGVRLTRPLPLQSLKQRTPFEIPPKKKPVRTSYPNYGTSQLISNSGPPSGAMLNFARLVPVRGIEVKQEPNEIKIQATGVAPNGTWDIFLKSKGVQNGVLYLEMMGYPTQSWTSGQRTWVQKTTQLSWPDNYHRVTRVVVRGDQKTQSQAYVHPPGSGGFGSTAPNDPGPGTINDPTGQRVASLLTSLARDYERDQGASAEALQRLRIGNSSRANLVESLNLAAEAASTLRNPLTADSKRIAVSKLLYRVEGVNRAISNVPSFPNGYRQRWQAVQKDIDYLAETSPGAIRP
jgi:hypothetical protein